MKKLVLALAAFMCLLVTSEAQIFKYGLKAGIGFSSLRIEDVTDINQGSDVYDLVTGDAVMGYHFGFRPASKSPCCLFSRKHILM